MNLTEGGGREIGLTLYPLGLLGERHTRADWVVGISFVLHILFVFSSKALWYSVREFPFYSHRKAQEVERTNWSRGG